MRRRPAFLALLILAAAIGWLMSTAVAEQVGYRFNGTVISVMSLPWQSPIAAVSPLQGAFIYDTLSTPTHSASDCDCVGYRQQRLNGFFANIGGLNVRADDYVVEVRNNAPFNVDDEADVIAVSFASNLSPALELPLVVDSVPRAEGLFSLSFAGSNSLFETPTLPSMLSLGSFHTKLGLLSDTTEGIIDVLFSITSLTRLDLLPGDYDLNNHVNVDDYQKWKTTYGSSGDLMADGNRDGIVDAADYTVWRNSVQPMAGFSLEGVHSNVPEPPVVVPLVTSIGWLFLSYRHRMQVAPRRL